MSKRSAFNHVILSLKAMTLIIQLNSPLPCAGDESGEELTSLHSLPAANLHARPVQGRQRLLNNAINQKSEREDALLNSFPSNVQARPVQGNRVLLGSAINPEAEQKEDFMESGAWQSELIPSPTAYDNAKAAAQAHIHSAHHQCNFTATSHFHMRDVSEEPASTFSFHYAVQQEVLQLSDEQMLADTFSEVVQGQQSHDEEHEALSTLLQDKGYYITVQMDSDGAHVVHEAPVLCSKEKAADARFASMLGKVLLQMPMGFADLEVTSGSMPENTEDIAWDSMPDDTEAGPSGGYEHTILIQEDFDTSHQAADNSDEDFDEPNTDDASQDMEDAQSWGIQQTDADAHQDAVDEDAEDEQEEDADDDEDYLGLEEAPEDLVKEDDKEYQEYEEIQASLEDPAIDSEYSQYPHAMEAFEDHRSNEAKHSEDEQTSPKDMDHIKRPEDYWDNLDLTAVETHNSLWESTSKWEATLAHKKAGLFIKSDEEIVAEDT